MYSSIVGITVHGCTPGEIDGTVTDDGGAVIQNTTVTITNTDTNKVIRVLKTNSHGEYAATLLPMTMVCIYKLPEREIQTL